MARQAINLGALPTKHGLIDSKQESKIAKQIIEDVYIKVGSQDDACSSLSGGNMQKVVFGKCLAMQPEIFLLNNPTRGIDVGARLEIYKLIASLASKGMSLILLSEDLNELITAFVQDKQTIEKGIFDGQHAGGETLAEELTQVRMGKIVKEKFPNLDDEDQEAVRQHAIAALNFVQQAKKELTGGGATETQNTALIDGVRKFALSVTDLDIDLIDRINPFGEAYAILAKSMTEERLKQVEQVIAGRRSTLTLEEARDLAKRALKFKQEKGRLPALTAMDPWEKRMAEGIAFLQRKVKETGNG